jgi:prolyl-tRNA synthetase
MRTRPFLRTTEFLWQEGHTAHATHQEAEEEVYKMLNVYKEFAEEYLAMPVIPGEKSESERFAGADRTFTIEAMMQDGKALQAGTSHDLGQNFSKAFDIQFTDTDGKNKYTWLTSWGLSTRMIGGLIMTHSDDQGLVLPPKIAPIKVVIVPIWKNDEEKIEVLKVANKLKDDLGNWETKLDDRDNVTPGWKFNEWEKKGVPIRIEIGPRDIENNSAVLARRDTGEKDSVSLDDVSSKTNALLEEVQKNLFEKAKNFRDENIYSVDTFDELKDVVENKNGFALAHWDGTIETEEKIKELTKATIRCIPFDSPEEEGKCIYSGKPSKKRVLFAKAY